jgi:hypothetical protein
MRGRSWEKFEAARRQARLALGKDPDGADVFDGGPKPANESVPAVDVVLDARPKELVRAAHQLIVHRPIVAI